MEQAWSLLKTSILKGKEYETKALKQGTLDLDFKNDMQRVVCGLRSARKRHLETQEETDLSDARLSKLAKFTDGLPLLSYEKILHLTPRLVNVVTVGDAASSPSLPVLHALPSPHTSAPAPSIRPSFG